MSRSSRTPIARAAGVLLASLAGLIAAGCTTVRVSASDEGWTIHDDPDGRTATRQVADIETSVRLSGPESAFPLDVTILNHGSAPVDVEIHPLFQIAGGYAIGEVRTGRTDTDPGAPVVLHCNDSTSIPPCVDGVPGALRVALRRSSSPDNARRERSVACRHADADYEVVAHLPDGDVAIALKFDVALLVCDSQAVSVAGDVALVLLVAAGFVVLAGLYAGH